MLRRPFALLASLALGAVFAVAAPTPAAAASCATAGHTYTIHNGTVYLSGYEGNHQFGIQTLVLIAGTPFQVGGNGLKPDSFVEFFLTPGETVPPWIPFNQILRPRVGGNCVVNQQWVHPPPSFIGTYQVHADYSAGNSGTHAKETSVFIIFIPPPPDGGGGGGGGGDDGGGGGGECPALLPCPV